MSPCALASPTTSRAACSKTRMNSRPMILRFSSGSVTPASASRNCSRASTTCRSTPVAATKSRSTCSASPCAQQAVVDEHAGEPVADGPLHQRRGDRGVDAAGQPADRPAVADLGADPLDLLVDDVGRRPGRPSAGDVVQEVLEHLLAVLGVQHLGVELHAGQPAVDVLERRHRGAGDGRGDGEPVGRRGDRVAVAHPHRLLAGSVAEAAGRRSVTVSSVRPYSRSPVCATVPPSACAIAWKP